MSVVHPAFTTLENVGIFKIYISQVLVCLRDKYLNLQAVDESSYAVLSCSVATCFSEMLTYYLILLKQNQDPTAISQPLPCTQPTSTQLDGSYFFQSWHEVWTTINSFNAIAVKSLRRISTQPKLPQVFPVPFSALVWAQPFRSYRL